MRSFILIICLLFAVNGIGLAQNTVVDTHPTATIFAIDYSTGQQTPATYDVAILFKNAFIDLVSNTAVARMQMARVVPGRKNFVITQLDPQANGNAYQLTLQSKFLNQSITIYTFVYNADQNVLSYFDQQSRGYVPVAVQGYNVNNLNNCFSYGKFNAQQPPAVAAVDVQADAAPIDADVTTTSIPPALPDYDQPECPVDGYLWQPGYWAYGRDVNDYYWVPGAWVAPPSIGLLWTPPYWGFDGRIYAFHSGYWGNTIGFYGGVNYGFGYIGVGFVGGDWREGHFRYNTAVMRVNERVVHNVYIDRTVIVVNNNRNHTSFNGRGGIIARPNDREMAAMRESHVMPTHEQIINQRAARADKSQFASSNGGRPTNVATERVVDRRPATNGNPGSNQPNGRQGMNGNPAANPSNGRQGMNSNPGVNQPNGIQNGRQNMNSTQGVTAPSATPVTPPTGSNQPNTYPGRRPGMNNAPATNGQTPAAPTTTPGNNQTPPAQGVRPGANQTPPAQGAPGTNKTPAKTPVRTRVPVKTPPPPVKTEKP